MPIPDYQTLMLPVLRASGAEEVRVGELIARLAGELHLTDEERTELLPSGRQSVFANRVHWAKFYLTKAGLLESTRHAHFRVTPRGQQVLASPPADIDNEYLGQFEEFRKFKEASTASVERTSGPVAGGSQASTPDEIMRTAHSSIEASLSQDLLDRIRQAPPDFFEKLIINLLLKMGFGGTVVDAARALGKPGDDGVDGVIDQDALGLDRVYVQAKRYAAENTVGPGSIRDFFGSLDRHKASKGLFVTTSSFSQSAKETAAFLSKRIVLIDGNQLSKLLIRYNVGCRIEETLDIKKIDEEFFEAANPG